MVIVRLGDGTIYHIDGNDVERACQVVEFKLRQRSDTRSIQSTSVVPGAVMDPTHKTYNSNNPHDGCNLVCVRGWSYKCR